MLIQISWLLQKPTDLDLHCLQRQGYPGSAGQGLIAKALTLFWPQSSILENGVPLKPVLGQGCMQLENYNTVIQVSMKPRYWFYFFYVFFVYGATFIGFNMEHTYKHFITVLLHVFFALMPIHITCILYITTDSGIDWKFKFSSLES